MDGRFEAVRGHAAAGFLNLTSLFGSLRLMRLLFLLQGATELEHSVEKRRNPRLLSTKQAMLYSCILSRHAMDDLLLLQTVSFRENREDMMYRRSCHALAKTILVLDSGDYPKSHELEPPLHPPMASHGLPRGLDTRGTSAVILSSETGREATRPVIPAQSIPDGECRGQSCSSGKDGWSRDKSQPPPRFQ